MMKKLRLQRIPRQSVKKASCFGEGGGKESRLLPFKRLEEIGSTARWAAAGHNPFAVRVPAHRDGQSNTNGAHI
jgi:hypothetical protein